MPVLVSNTSVLIDLERGGLIKPCFSLPFDFAVPHLLYERELAEYNGPEWVKCGLQLIDLEPPEVSLAQQIRAGCSKLSVPDAYAYALAATRNWTLLTGDGHLRTVATDNGIGCNGALWVTDQLFEARTIEVDVLVAGLQGIVAHPRCRLPKAEIEARLQMYQAAAPANAEAET